MKPTKRRGALLALRAVVDQPSDCLFLVALLGWVSLFLFGIYHRLHPAVDLNPLASVQVWIWIVSTVTLTIGVALVHLGRAAGDPLAAVSSLLFLPT